MPTPRTSLPIHVRNYEVQPDGTVSPVFLMRWFQEAAEADSSALGFGTDRYRQMGVAWVMRAMTLEMIEAPRYDDELHVSTWIPAMERVRAYREFDAQRRDGTLLARCSTEWAMLNIETERPTRIPAEILDAFGPSGAFALERRAWPDIQREAFESSYRVPAWEEDLMGHVNNANYLKWIEENARRAALARGVTPPRFRQHHLQFRLPAFKDEELRWSSRFMEEGEGALWQHEISRGGDLLVRGWSIQGALVAGRSQVTEGGNESE